MELIEHGKLISKASKSYNLTSEWIAGQYSFLSYHYAMIEDDKKTALIYIEKAMSYEHYQKDVQKIYKLIAGKRDRK